MACRRSKRILRRRPSAAFAEAGRAGRPSPHWLVGFLLFEKAAQSTQRTVLPAIQQAFELIGRYPFHIRQEGWVRSGARNSHGNSPASFATKASHLRETGNSASIE